MFLRVGCSLPDGLGLKQQHFSESWMSVENMLSPVLDVGLRAKGWHFMWLEGAHSRLGIGRTEQSATGRAITLVLNQIKGSLNAAELDSINVSRYPGFWIAKGTLHARQIQQQSCLGPVDEVPIRPIQVV